MSNPYRENLQKTFSICSYARGVLDLDQHVLEVRAARVVGYAVVVKIPEIKKYEEKNYK